MGMDTMEMRMRTRRERRDEKTARETTQTTDDGRHRRHEISTRTSAQKQTSGCIEHDKHENWFFLLFSVSFFPLSDYARETNRQMPGTERI